MSNHTFDTVETTLKSLKDIVDRNHSQSVETSRLVTDMELLISEMKTKAGVELTKVNKLDTTMIAIPNPGVVSLSM